MRKLKVHIKILSIANPSMAARCPNGDLPMIIGFIVVRRRPAGVTAGAPADRRRDISQKFCHLLSESGGGRTVSRRHGFKPWLSQTWAIKVGENRNIRCHWIGASVYLRTRACSLPDC